MAKKNTEHQWDFIQTAGLVQVQIKTIEDVLNLKNLDPKLWVALACPTNGVDFPQETMTLLDTDKNGRVRQPEILHAVEYIKKYLAKPEVIMTPGDSIPIDAFSDEILCCDTSAKNAAKSILKVLNKGEQQEISLSDVNETDKLFSAEVYNGDGILTPQSIKDENLKSIVQDAINCTGGSDDISGQKGINREQTKSFFQALKDVEEWKSSSTQNAPEIFFLKEATDIASESYFKVKEKIDDYFLRCSVISYDNEAQTILKEKADSFIVQENAAVADHETLRHLPLSQCASGKPLTIDNTINPAWFDDMASFKKNVLDVIAGKEVSVLSEENWKKIVKKFKPYSEWFVARPENSVSSLGLDRIAEILSNDNEKQIFDLIEKEEHYPSSALTSSEIKKLILLRRDFVTLLKNFVSFEQFYNPKTPAIFQCGTLYIDGRTCDMCFRVFDEAKHATMATLSQCYLLYCDCVKHNSNGEKMKIGVMVSDGAVDNLMIGRNGIFIDRKGNDWDATITKIVENPVSVKQAFFSPYKKLMRMIQEKIAKTANKAEQSVLNKMQSTVDAPAANAPKKTDIGTVAALSVAFTGIATVVGALLEAFLGLGKWIPLGIIGIVLVISLPSMFIAWTKLRQRNIAPILDASGWAVNGNVKISSVLGKVLTHTAQKPATAYLSTKDPFAEKKFPLAKILLTLILIGLICLVVYCLKEQPSWWTSVCNDFKSHVLSQKDAVTNQLESLKE